MDIKKYKKLAKIIFFLLIVLLLIAFFVLPNKDEIGELVEEESEGISTEESIFQTSSYNNGKLVQDFLNPTSAEISAVNAKYGIGNVTFSGDGLHISATNEDEVDRLMTDIWPDTWFTNNVVKPNMDISLIEVSDTYLNITLENVEKKDLEKYIKSIDDEFSNELYSRHLETIFRAHNENNMIVNIKFYPESSTALIEYGF